MKRTFVMSLGILGLMMGKELWADTYVSGTITSNTTWTQVSSPYIATDTVTVAQGVALTIEPGVTVMFATETSLIVFGTLIAIGNLTGTITFTGQSATPGYWQSIKFSGSNAKGTISYCDIGYAKQAVYLEDVSGVIITHNYIHNNKGNNGASGSSYLPSIDKVALL